jgi:hypothetical protein
MLRVAAAHLNLDRRLPGAGFGGGLVGVGDEVANHHLHLHPIDVEAFGVTLRSPG